ncbi:MAG TPA: response regulator transcription factor [Tepidisphaeraceae bacterium]|nr:response regulator transcription factor [Tepidisphaeraceae bacterium]
MKTPLSPKAVVWLIEDHADSRRVLARVLNRAATLLCPCAFASCEEALAALRSKASPPDVVLLDIGLPGMNGIEGISHLKALAPSTHIIILTVFDDQEKVFRAICAGASGYLLKNTDEEAIASAVREVMEGGSPINPRVARLVLNMFASRAAPATQEYGLSLREREVLELMVQGLLKKEIADRLKLSYHTVDNHLRNIYTKLQVHTRSGAVAKALSEHLLSST